MRIQACAAAVAMAGALGVWLPTVSAAQEKQKFRARDIPRLMEEADKFIAANELPKAEAYLKAIIEVDPKQAQAAFKLANVCERQNDQDCALLNYQLALASLTGTQKAQAHAGLAAGHVRAGRDTDAAEHAKAAVGLDPSLAGAHIILAESLVRLKSPDAVGAAQAAAAAAPDNPAAHRALGDALVAADRAADAEAPLRRAIELDPKLVAAHVQLTMILQARGDVDGVIASATRVIDLEPSRTEMFALRGRANLTKGQTDAALRDLHAAAAAGSKDATLHLAIAKMHHDGRQLDLAAQYYQSATQLDGQLADAWLGLSEVHVARNDFASAREPITRAVGVAPGKANAQYLLGLLREQEQQYDAALEALAKAIGIDATLSGAYHAQGRLLRTHRKDTAGGLASLRKAAELDAGNPAVLTDLAAALYEGKQNDQVVAILEKVTTAPGYANPVGYLVFGAALMDKGAYGDAVPLLTRAAELEPKWAEAHRRAAWALFGSIKKGCPCGPEDEQRVKQMKTHFDQMVALGAADPNLKTRVDALVDGQKVR
ncbi:MAG: tetratricopeptide repeat protein [Acidobacteria bacterium]|nr:tetratricopeptide repeat protein [Acidobacteriota bacterium]